MSLSMPVGGPTAPDAETGTYLTPMTAALAAALARSEGFVANASAVTPNPMRVPGRTPSA